jgi:hypothetical protein
MLGVEWRVFDHPKASDDLILAQPCTHISHSILKIEQFLSNENVNSGDSSRQTALRIDICRRRVPHKSCYQHQGANPDTDHTYPSVLIIALYETLSSASCKKKVLKTVNGQKGEFILFGESTS